MCDRDALVEIYRTSTGRKWTNTTNWDSDERYGLWYGVKVDVAGHVLRLGLNNNNLEGVIPRDPIMKYLKNIVCLDLSSNYLYGDIPEWIGSLAHLEELNLSWNQLTGTVFNFSLKSTIKMNYAFFENVGVIPDVLFDLVELKLLRLDSNHLSGEIVERLGNLRNIIHINLSKNQFSGE